MLPQSKATPTTLEKIDESGKIVIDNIFPQK
jgi:hypothetical protein